MDTGGVSDKSILKVSQKAYYIVSSSFHVLKKKNFYYYNTGCDFYLSIKVAIQADLEKKIIKLINEFRQENGDKGPISGRLTSKKLLVNTKHFGSFQLTHTEF